LQPSSLATTTTQRHPGQGHQRTPGIGQNSQSNTNRQSSEKNSIALKTDQKSIGQSSQQNCIEQHRKPNSIGQHSEQNSFLQTSGQHGIEPHSELFSADILRGLLAESTV